MLFSAAHKWSTAPRQQLLKVGADKQVMLERVGFSSLDDLIDSAVPASIRLHKSLSMDEPMSESEALAKLKSIMAKNKV